MQISPTPPEPPHPHPHPRPHPQSCKNGLMIRKWSLTKRMFSNKFSLDKGIRSKTGATHPHKFFSEYPLPRPLGWSPLWHRGRRTWRRSRNLMACRCFSSSTRTIWEKVGAFSSVICIENMIEPPGLSPCFTKSKILSKFSNMPSNWC